MLCHQGEISCADLVAVDELEHARKVILVDGTLPVYSQRFVQYTDSMDVIVVQQMRDFAVGDPNPAFAGLKAIGYNPFELGIAQIFSASDVQLANQQKSCRRQIASLTISSKDTEIVQNLFSQAIIQYLSNHVPTWATDLFGFASGYTPTWVQKLVQRGVALAKSLVSNPMIFLLSTILYTIVKGMICIYTLPGAKLATVRKWLSNQFVSEQGTVRAIMSIISTMLECSSGVSVATCFLQAAKSFSKILGVTYTWLKDLLSWFVPIGPVHLDKLRQFNPVWSSAASLKDMILTSKGYDQTIVDNVVATYFPTTGLRLLEMVIGLCPHLVSPDTQAILNTFRKRVLRTTIKGVDALMQLIHGLRNYHQARIVVVFVYQELKSLFECFVLNKNCCFSKEIVNVWTNAVQRGKTGNMLGFNKYDFAND
jgi:hypothetical protein